MQMTDYLEAGLYQKILDENIKLHRAEAGHYETLHPEEFNWFEQKRIWQDIKFIQNHLSRNPLALDLGCGTGNICLKLLHLGIEVWGVDISKEMLGILERKAVSKPGRRVTLFQKDADNFLDGCTQVFDLITVSSVLHHLPEYLKTLDKAVNLLKQGGLLYITHEPTSSALSKDRFLRKLLWQLDNLFYLFLNSGRVPSLGKRDYRLSDYHLYHNFNEDNLVSECRRFGLEVIKFEKYSSTMRLGISNWLDFRLLGSKRQFCLIARKTL